MSSAGRAASLSGCVARPRGRETGLTGYAEQIQRSLPTGGSAMETAEHREPYESRGSRTDLGAPGGESPPGDSTRADDSAIAGHRSFTPSCGRTWEPLTPALRATTRRSSSLPQTAPVDLDRSLLRTEKFVLNGVTEKVSRIARKNWETSFPVPVIGSLDQPVADRFDGIRIGHHR